MKMITKSFAAIALVFLSVGVWGAGKSLRDWLKELEAKIYRTEDKRKTRLISAAAVRGRKEDEDARKLYWKGKTSATPVTQKELEQFKAAVALAKEGKNEEAKKSLDVFLEENPNSALTADAKATLALLKQQAPMGDEAIAQ